MPNRPENQIVFVMTMTEETPTIVIGVPEGAYEFLRTGKVQTLDFRKAGLNIRLQLFGGRSNSECFDTISQSLGGEGIAVVNAPDSNGFRKAG